MEQMKKCLGCKKPFPNTPDHFGRKHKGDDIHLLPRCKECMKEKHREWRQNNPEKARERCNRWHHNNLEHSRAQLRERARRRLAKQRQQASV